MPFVRNTTVPCNVSDPIPLYVDLAIIGISACLYGRAASFVSQWVSGRKAVKPSQCWRIAQPDAFKILFNFAPQGAFSEGAVNRLLGKGCALMCFNRGDCGFSRALADP